MLSALFTLTYLSVWLLSPFLHIPALPFAQKGDQVQLRDSKTCLFKKGTWLILGILQFPIQYYVQQRREDTTCYRKLFHQIVFPDSHFKVHRGTSLVVQWLRIRLPMQGTWVRALVWEDPTCCGATKPVHHNYWACALEPVLHNKRSHRNEKPAHCNKE